MKVWINEYLGSGLMNKYIYRKWVNKWIHEYLESEWLNKWLSIGSGWTNKWLSRKGINELMTI